MSIVSREYVYISHATPTSHLPRRDALVLHLSSDDTVESLLEPGDGLLGSDLVGRADSSGLGLSSGNSHAWSAHDDEEVHTEDTDSRVVLNTEVDVLVDTETEVSGLGEVSVVSIGWASVTGSEPYARRRPSSIHHPVQRREQPSLRCTGHIPPCHPSRTTPHPRPHRDPLRERPYVRRKDTSRNSPLPQLVLLDLQSSLQNLLRLGTSDSDVDGDLLVPSDAERSDGVSGLGRDGGLTGELLEHLGGSGQPVSGFTNGDVCGISFLLVFLLMVLTD